MRCMRRFPRPARGRPMHPLYIPSGPARRTARQRPSLWACSLSVRKALRSASALQTRRRGRLCCRPCFFLWRSAPPCCALLRRTGLCYIALPWHSPASARRGPPWRVCASARARPQYRRKACCTQGQRLRLPQSLCPRLALLWAWASSAAYSRSAWGCTCPAPAYCIAQGRKMRSRN